MSVNLSFANEDDDAICGKRIIKGKIPKVVERYSHQLSPVSHQKTRRESLDTLERTSISSNPFLLKDKNSNYSGDRQRNAKDVEKLTHAFDKQQNNDCDVNNDEKLSVNLAVSQKSPKVVIESSESIENFFDFSDFDGNNNNKIKVHRKSSYQYSSELLSWYKDTPSIGKSSSLPRKLLPPPASPRTTRHRQTASSVKEKGQKVLEELPKIEVHNSPGVHTVKGTPHRYHNNLINQLQYSSQGVAIRSAPQSPSKSATLPPSHRLTPQHRHPLQYSQSVSAPRSQPPSPQSGVRRRASLLSSPSILKRSPTLPKKKSGSYKNLGFNEQFADVPEVKVQRSFSISASKKHRSSTGSKKKSEWRPVDMTNYEGYYPDESSDGEMTEPSTTSGEHHHKSYDSVIFDVLKVSPEDFASQLTILDLAAFKEILPQELTSCGWIKKDKAETSPNVVQMTQRFNNTSFYVVHEILHAQTLKIRAEIVIHFIRIAKKLHDLNNLHSLMAVISSLNSTPIHRLKQTWGLVNKHHRATFDRLRCLVSEDNNRMNLRKHIEGIKLPCIPYLGLYLQDLMYVDSAHPDTGGLESHERTNKMNNILRILSEFQQSSYDHLREIPHIKNFLQSVKYIEELQRFAEEENYKRSLRIEPNHLSTPMKALASSREELTVPDHSLPRRSMTPPSGQLFKPGHRKSHSLGRDIRPRTDPAKIHKRRSFVRMKSRDYSACNGLSPPQPPATLHRVQSSPDQSGSLPRNSVPPTRAHLPVVMTTSLLDDSIISSGATPSLPSNSGSIGSSRSNSGSEFSDDTSWNGISSSEGKMNLGRCMFEGYLKRKTVLRRGRKPPITTWTRYWVCLYNSQLVFYPAKVVRGNERRHFKQSPCKMITIREWMVLCSDDPAKLDSFQLSNPNQGDIYRFQCDSKEVALVWVKNLQEAIKGTSPPEKDLIQLHDS